MKQIILLFAAQVLEKNLVFIFSEYLQETMNGILNGESTEGENPKKYLCLWNTLSWISAYNNYV